jgi:hypothetical protein
MFTRIGASAARQVDVRNTVAKIHETKRFRADFVAGIVSISAKET